MTTDPTPNAHPDAEIAALRAELGAAIEARARAEHRAEVSERRFCALVGQNRGLVLEIDAAGRYAGVWTERESLLARPRAELMGRTIVEALGEELARPFCDLVQRVLATGVPERLEYPLEVLEGTCWFAADARLAPRAAGDPATVLFIARDVTERHRAEAALRASEERHRLLFDLGPLPTWVIDQETMRFLAVNDAAVAAYGYSRAELLSMTLPDLWIPADAGQRASDFRQPKGEGARTFPSRHRTRAGAILEVEVTSHLTLFEGRPARLGVAIDVTARRRLEGQLRQAQKMDALGRLAGGVAHDFNNLLSVILGTAEMLLGALPAPDERREDVDEILRAGQRAASLTGQLLAFSRKQVQHPEPIDLSELVGELGKMLERIIGEDVHLTMTLRHGIGQVMADRGQLTQVLLNLVVNARDAMPNGGSMRIATDAIVVREKISDRFGDVPPGRYVRLSVSDTGTGMEPPVLARLFEPFFTTKPPGKGTGLGLSTVFGIVKQSGGAISVDTSPGGGTTFIVYLPATANERDRDHAARRLSSRPAPAGGETILLVEDDAQVRRVTRRFLERAGYAVVEASDGRRALAAFEAATEPIALVITDLVMPGIDGLAMVAELEARGHTVEVLFVSGFTEHAALREGRLVAGVNFLQKPCSASELVALVSKVRET